MTRPDVDDQDPSNANLQIQIHEGTSWNGAAKTASRPSDCPLWTPPPDFHFSFHSDPCQSISTIQLQYPELAEPVNLGLFIFYTPQLFPRAVTRLIFDERSSIHPISFLFFFFRAVDMDFTSIPEAAHRVLSHLAFPFDMGKFALIIDSFARAYFDSNPYVIFTIAEIELITISAIAYSMYKGKSARGSYDMFSKWLRNCAIPEKYKQQLHQMTEQFRIPIFFDLEVFQTAPEFHQTGCFSKNGTSSSAGKKRYFVFDPFVLRYFDDVKQKTKLGEIELIGTFTTREKEGIKKGQEILRIKRFDGQVFGSKFSHGRKKPGHHKEFVLLPHGKQSLNGWCEACNIFSFLASMANHYRILI
jgi:hypothetical protein